MTYNPAAGASNFLALTDTPGAYAAQAGESVRVNGGETALEYYTPGGGGGGGPPDYSTSEVDSGQLWHNGKTIFQKTFPGIAGAGVGVQTNTAHGITTIEEMIDIKEFGDNGTNFFPGNRNFSGARNGTFVDGTDILRRADLSTEVGYTFAVTLYYTKV